MNAETRSPIAPADSTSGIPLFVDLDGTLIRTDLLLESFFSRLRKDPLLPFKSCWWLLQGRARLKAELASTHAIDVTSLPFHAHFLAYLREQAAGGRELVLATASHRALAEAVASHVGIFSAVIATEGERNLKGQVKLAAIRERVGAGAYDYAGNGSEDIPIWADARRALLVGGSESLRRRLERDGKIAGSFPAENRVAALGRALRPHQWLKNALLFIPLLASVSFGSATAWLQAGIAFVIFCALASGTYLLNDLLDLREDRAHPRKRLRPLAAGALGPAAAVSAAGLLFGLAFALALLLPWKFAVVAATYFVVTLAYSMWLKTKLMADVITLAGLYTLRVIAGCAAIGVPASFWLLAFSVFIFFSLALVKRCAELAMRRQRGEEAATAGGYRVQDFFILQALGIGSACAAVLVMALYIHSPEVTVRLRSPALLWAICPVMLYWLGHTWVIATRGEMQDDPIVFAVTDRASLAAGAATLAFFLAAALVDLSAVL